MSQKTWRIIRNTEDHAMAMSRLIELASCELQPGSDEFEEFELLGLLIEHYENKQFPMEKPSAVEAIKFRMDQQGLSQSDMRQYIGSASKVSEVLNYKRPLSLSMIRGIHRGLGIPLDILLQVDERFLSKNTDTNEWEILGSELIETMEANAINDSMSQSNNFKSLSPKKQLIDMYDVISFDRRDEPCELVMQDRLGSSARVDVEISAGSNISLTQYQDSDFIRVIH
ncbi:hypothetical protein [uncultured Cedecea sp.]|uniref:helix-turn-helix domain-containing protein n=1 Tax=uncultured Cedecea sp. TaxID=988762 RepID=UPI002635DEFC|nr:hypothetical protein [uncultured Cedecea sp.]